MRLDRAGGASPRADAHGRSRDHRARRSRPRRRSPRPDAWRRTPLSAAARTSCLPATTSTPSSSRRRAACTRSWGSPSPRRVVTSTSRSRWPRASPTGSGSSTRRGAAGIVAAIGFNRRFHPAIRRARAVVRAGRDRTGQPHSHHVHGSRAEPAGLEARAGRRRWRPPRSGVASRRSRSGSCSTPRSRT